MEDKRLYLDRRRIVPDYTDQIPLIVLIDMASGQRIRISPEDSDVRKYSRRLYRSIQVSPVYTFNIIPEDHINNYLVNYLMEYLSIDPVETFTLDELLDIYNFWESCINALNRNDLTVFNVSRIGKPTRMFPYALNASFLYRICQTIGITTPDDINLETLGHIVRFSLKGTDSIPGCIDLINRHLLQTDYNGILSMVAQLPKEAFGERTLTSSARVGFYPTHNNLLSVNGKFKFKSVIDKRTITPMNTKEAVYLGIVNYGINLFKVRNPIMEYNNFHKFCLDKYPDYYLPNLENTAVTVTEYINFKNYQAIDNNLMRYIQFNPNLFTLNVFELSVPETIYPRGILNQLAVERPHDIYVDSAYSNNCQSVLTDTFYLGWYPEISNDQTPFFYEELNNMNLNDLIESNNLIVYGTPSNGLLGLTLTELTHLFKNNQTLENKLPGQVGLFTEMSIKHLKIICRDLETDLGSKLLIEIEIIDAIQKMNNDKFNLLKQRFENHPCDNVLIQCLLKSMLRLSMFMRGWNGLDESPYPLDGIVQVEAGDIDINVCNSIKAFEDMINTHPDIGGLFMTLPIMRLNHGNFVLSTDTKEGYTIRERLDIIKRGENLEDNNSCIRLSSNWFAITVWRYYQILRLDVPFNLSDIRTIS